MEPLTKSAAAFPKTRLSTPNPPTMLEFLTLPVKLKVSFSVPPRTDAALASAAVSESAPSDISMVPPRDPLTINVSAPLPANSSPAIR